MAASRSTFIRATIGGAAALALPSRVSAAQETHVVGCPDCTDAFVREDRLLAQAGPSEAPRAFPPDGGITVPTIRYSAVPNAVVLPENQYFGECAGVALNSKGHVFVFTRANTNGPAYGAAAAQLLEFAPDGRFVREIGKNLYAWSYAHTVKVDRYDNIWVTDKGSDMVVKFDPKGRVQMVFGRKQEASDESTAPLKHPNPPLPPENGYFRQVTDVAWDSNDNAYISDGYINSRIAKVDKNGNWLMSFGEPGTGPGQFNTPHSIAIDAQNRIYVGDRGNRRIQVFDTNGTFIKQIHIDVAYDTQIKAPIGPQPTGAMLQGSRGPGSPWAIAISPGPKQYLYAADAYPGRIYKMTLDGTVIGVLGRAGKLPMQFGWIHQMAVPREDTIFVAEVLNWRVQKLRLYA